MPSTAKQQFHFDPLHLGRSRQRKIRWLRHYMEVTGLNPGEVAQLAGVSRQTMYSFTSGTADIYLATWEVIERFLIKAGMKLD